MLCEKGGREGEGIPYNLSFCSVCVRVGGKLSICSAFFLFLLEIRGWYRIKFIWLFVCLKGKQTMVAVTDRSCKSPF